MNMRCLRRFARSIVKLTVDSRHYIFDLRDFRDAQVIEIKRSPIAPLRVTVENESEGA
jgi:hypothetical protein